MIKLLHLPTSISLDFHSRLASTQQPIEAADLEDFITVFNNKRFERMTEPHKTTDKYGKVMSRIYNHMFKLIYPNNYQEVAFSWVDFCRWFETHIDEFELVYD